MKYKIFISFFCAILIANLAILSLNGQKDVYLKINNLLHNETFEFGKEAKNNFNQAFKVERIDYYISNIALHHDNGVISKPDSLYLLIEKNKNVNLLLGDFYINKLDSITFNIGIDSVTNHADPALYPAEHPLAPKDPDMHWGWAAGYKFIVIEGKNGPDMIYDFQLHAFGDRLLTAVSVPTVGKDENGALIVELNADYSQCMNDMNLSKIVIFHGVNKDVLALMKNFQKSVFKPVNALSTVFITNITNLSIFPNPTSQEFVTIELLPEQSLNTNLVIKDLLGRIIQTIDSPQLSNQIAITERGFYIVELQKNNKVINTGTFIKI